jgi:RNA polymerase sigma-54 factor
MLKQHLQLKLSQKLSPQQIQLMKLMQLSTLDFEQRLQYEIEQNPALEKGKENKDDDDSLNNEFEENFSDNEDINIDNYLTDDEVPNYKFNSKNYSNEEDEKTIPIAGEIGFHQLLKNQISSLILNKKETLIAEFIIGSIDDSGYIRRTKQDLVDDLAFTQNIFIEEKELSNILKKVQSLDPPGIASNTLKECLSIQLSRKPASIPQIMASKIINEGFDLFSKKHFDKLKEKFDVNEDLLKDGLKEIEKLNPKPGGALSGIIQNNHIVPDFILKIENDSLLVSINNRNAPELHISNSYMDMMKGYKESKTKNKSQKQAIQFIKQKLDSAQWFIDAIKQRHQTLLKTINAIVDFQKDFLLSGDENLIKPMILKDIAEKIDMDISTISRVANSKYLETPYGTKLLKSFFSESLKNNLGEEVSTLEIKNILKGLIDNEDKKHPLPDIVLSNNLKEKGYKVARRTIAKYREQLGFSVARLRKKL